MNKIQFLFSSLFLYNLILFNSIPANAQITPDNTLGNESSQINSNVLIKGFNAEQINGGATRGSNLFHSFSEFNIKDGQKVYFANPSGVLNILTRVTGKDASSIFGTLGVDGNANLFLMNPNGILFGKNASLDVQGSFVGTTANGLKFGNQGVFSATNPEAPGLLTINPNALAFSQQQSGAVITNQSQVPAGKNSAGFDALGLRVLDGKSLLLVGGNVSIDGGRLNAFGGRVELGGLAEPGNINLLSDGNNLSLGFPDNVTRADVSLTNQAGAYVTGAGGGNLVVNARNIDILGGSILSAGIVEGLGTPETVAGNIILNTTGEINIAGSGSKVRNLVRTDSIGNGGNITIDAGSFKLSDGAQLDTSTYGKGDAGNVTVTVKDAISLANGDIFSAVEAGGVGKGGNINTNGATLSLSDSAQLLTITRGADGTQLAGRGDAGDVNIKVSGIVDIAGVKNGFSSGIFSYVGTGTEGNGGNITIDTGSLKLHDGAVLSTSTYGKGDAGNVLIRSKDSVSLNSAYIRSNVGAGGVGKGGNIDINAASLFLRDGAQIQAAINGASGTQPAGRGDAGNVNVTLTGVVDIAGAKNDVASAIDSRADTGTVGNAGNITIDAGSFSLRDGARLNASIRGQGKAGNIDISVTGTATISGSKDAEVSAIFSNVLEGAKGNGGNITINAGSLSLIDGTQLITSTSGEGNAGNITVRAKDSIFLTDNAAIISTVEAGGVGKGGNINIDAASLTLINGGQLQALTRPTSDTLLAGRGDAGNVNIKVTGAVDIAGGKNGFISAIGSSVETDAVGNGGNITINAGSFSLQDGAQISASNFGRGNAGNVSLKVTEEVDIAGEENGFISGIRSFVDEGIVGDGGNVSIDAGSLSLRDEARLLTSNFGRGNAGNVTVIAKDAVSLTNGKILSTLGTGAIGNGGNIKIDTGSFSLEDGAVLETSTFGQGNAGDVTVIARNAIFLANGDIFSAVEAGGVGKGGNININGSTLSLTDGAQLITITREATDTQPPGKGDAGNVEINVTGAVNVAGRSGTFPSGIRTGVDQGTIGNGGNVTINSNSFSLTGGAAIFTGTDSKGKAGNVTINARESVLLKDPDNAIFSTTLENGEGKGGNIEINTASLSILNAAGITADTRGQGDAGNVKINATESVIISGKASEFIAGLYASAIAGAGREILGEAGNIEVNSPKITFDNQGQLSAESTSGNGGNININSDVLLLRRGGQITTSAGTEQAGGDGGNININSKFIVAVPKENSDILANAFTGKGGNINIQAQNIFGIEARPKPTNQSDITASSELGVQGQVSIRKPDVDPSRGLLQSPQNFKDKSNEIDQLCGRSRVGLERFVVVGKNGSIQSNPVVNMMSGDLDLTQLATLNEVNSNVPVNQIPDSLMEQKPTPNRIVEAQALVRGADGTLYLVAEAPNAIPNSRPAVSACAGVGSK
jgi:filamentous hemagglutinin family protein